LSTPKSLKDKTANATVASVANEAVGTEALTALSLSATAHRSTVGQAVTVETVNAQAVAVQATSPKVSILVPVYNVERYLAQCLDSLVAQTLQDIEIICINDGSSDGSCAIIQDYAAKDGRIRVIDKPNGGYGQAMNCGLAAASGTYLGIVESDDFIDPEAFARMYAAANTHDAEVVKCDFFLTWTTPRTREVYFHAIEPKDAGRLVDPYKDFQIIQPQPAIWSALYRRSLLEEHGIRFLETPGASFQDTSFNYKVYTVASRVFLLPQAFIHYRQDNATSSINATTKVDAVEKEFAEYFDFLADYPHKQRRMQLIMQDIVYKTYRWNALRIDTTHRGAYVDFMYDYFTAQDKAGLVERTYFEAKFYDELGLLLADKQKYLRLVNSPINNWLFRHNHTYHLVPGGLWHSLRDGAWWLKRKLKGIE
jgi:glycosyltransferase involved in cell wall biosynthesis